MTWARLIALPLSLKICCVVLREEQHCRNEGLGICAFSPFLIPENKTEESRTKYDVPTYKQSCSAFDDIWVHGMIIPSFRRNAMHSPGYAAEEQSSLSNGAESQAMYVRLWLQGPRGTRRIIRHGDPLAAKPRSGYVYDDSSISTFPYIRSCLRHKFCGRFTISAAFLYRSASAGLGMQLPVPHFLNTVYAAHTNGGFTKICAGF
jgi:hypothetical protein